MIIQVSLKPFSVALPFCVCFQIHHQLCLQPWRPPHCFRLQWSLRQSLECHSRQRCHSWVCHCDTSACGNTLLYTVELHFTHWGWDKTVAISKTTFSNAIFWVKFIILLFETLKYVPRVQLSMCQYWFRWWLSAEPVTSHYLNQWCLSLLMYICTTQPQWVKWLWPSHTMWWHRSESTLAQAMACCIRVPSHYLNQCWIIIKGIHLKAIS